jgi:hypothetical protein
VVDGPQVQRFLGWCVDQGVEWSSISLASWARFKHFVEATPHRGGRLRSDTTVNATLTAVCEFLRFCARTGVIEQAVADRLAEPSGTVATNMQQHRHAPGAAIEVTTTVAAVGLAVGQA